MNELSAAQHKLDAHCDAERARADVRREHHAVDDRKRYAGMSTAERCRQQADGFINDYD